MVYVVVWVNKEFLILHVQSFSQEGCRLRFQKLCGSTDIVSIHTRSVKGTQEYSLMELWLFESTNLSDKTAFPF